MNAEDDQNESRVFMFAGFSTQAKTREKEELTEKILSLGGEVDNSASWSDKCTHVIAANYQLFNVKVLAGLACGRWIVTRRYIDRCFKNGSWINTKPFICDQSVLCHRKRYFANGGCFQGYKVLFLVEQEGKRKAYIDVVRAGGGTVLEDWDLDQLIKYKPGPSEITHIVVDPFILSERDERYTKFKQWHDYSRQVWDPKKGEVLHYLYYKYFFDFLSDPTKKIIPHLYNIFNPRVLEQARENGDLRIPEKVPESKASTATPRKRAQDEENSGTKKQRTNISTTVLDSNVVELEDSDEDDIQILEQRLLAEGGRRRVYYKPRSEAAEEITLQSSDESDHEERRESSEDEESEEDEPCREDKPNQDPSSRPDLGKPSPSRPESAEEDEIEILETKVSQPQNKVRSRRSRIFKEKLHEMKKKEERRLQKEEKERERQLRLARESRESRGSEPSRDSDPKLVLTEPIPPPVLAMERLNLQDPEKKENTELLNRILSTLLERQITTDECIEISHATPRTSRYDKNKESGVKDIQSRPVGSHVQEEFNNRYMENKSEDARLQYSSDEDNEREAVNITLEDEANNYVAFLEILEYLKSFTSLSSHPTSSIINVIMREFIMNQKSLKVAMKSYQYLDQFLLLHLGKENMIREDWLNLILSALRDHENLDQFERFELENNQDIQSCWRFFSGIINRVSRGSGHHSGIMLSLLVKICQKDFELWWKHYRRTENKDNRDVSYPVLYYLLDGRRNLVENISSSILKLYQTQLEKGEDMTDIRKLVSMSGILLAHLDSQDKNVFLNIAKGLKTKFASKIQQIFAKSNLNSNELYMELNLLKPSWLSWLVSRRYLLKEKEKDIRGLQSILDQLEDISTSSDMDMFACLDTLIVKMIGTMHLHTVVRTHWSYQSKDISVFHGMNKLEKSGHRSQKVVRFKSDIGVQKSQLIEDANIIISHHNQEVILEGNTGVIKSALFKMSSSSLF
ncbi:uncharacterized protein LOC111712162 [Eurytemora carolleeae]|uniref:uncharacterized protein LOC111712162 n=1 Tax=Eurytemora carolleeae TaxID=1294199 RepID=UPI000C7707C1|nr:uncharacterized protein LOC111712162 [Eurytemora carolleeae]|eukprot:XP_023342474.1 uncharacterized protein LOC111712162 [Eurytemora affinis]